MMRLEWKFNLVFLGKTTKCLLFESYTILQRVDAYPHITIVCARLRLPDESSASYYVILCWGQFIKALPISRL